MSSAPSITPKALVEPIAALLLERRGEWLGPEELWQGLQRSDPELAERVQQKVRTYKDPTRNNAVWIISNTLSHIAKDPGFEVSDTDHVPEMKGKAFWMVARAT